MICQHEYQMVDSSGQRVCLYCNGKEPAVSDERLRNTRAWAAARIGQLSGAEVIVAACDEALAARAAHNTGLKHA